MASPIININKYINDYKNKNENIVPEDFRKYLFNNSIMTKYIEESNLLLVYHKYELPVKSLLEHDCRSLVIDMDTLKVISYTCQTPICNRDALKLLLNNKSELNVFRCYEGTLMSLFNHKNKWYLSTRRCLDSHESSMNDKSHYDMFIEVLSKDGTTFEDFTNKLNPEYGYYFILIHYENKHIIDYSKIFGDNYTKLCLAFIRNKEDQIEVSLDNFVFTENIFKSDRLTFEQFEEENKNLSINVEHEGIIVKTDSNLIKLQTQSYQFSKALGPESNIYKGYLYLYQIDILKSYIENNKEHNNLSKISNPYKQYETFDIIGVIDSVFKVFSSELFELYKLLWTLNTCEHQNVELYTILPKEYKDILYSLKGIYYKVKNDKKYFGITYIYEYMKLIDIDTLCALLRQRKLMFNWASLEKQNTNLKLFKRISNNCDISRLKLMAIFINKLYPEIMPTEIPKIEQQ
jgi:hypothetical protein